MKKHAFYLSLWCLLTALLLTGCKKEQPANPAEPIASAPAPPPIPTHYFDWETTTYMPSLPNANAVPMPWNAGTSAIDAHLAGDYKKADGWELVWNTFSPTVQLNDPGYTYFFALYNRYRGILRFYLWQVGTPLATSYIQHGLKLYGLQTSPMLNYAQEMADLNANQTQFSQMLNQQITLAGGSWMVFQYEIAYDPGLAATTFPSFGLEWDAKWAAVSQISLNGKITGEIKGVVGNPNAGGFNFGSFINKAFTTLWGAQGYASYLQLLSGDSSGGTYGKAMKNAADGIVKDFLNAVIGGSSSPVLPVNLTINTEVKLQGNIVTGGGLTNKKLVLPGQSNSQTADGNIPYYNAVMGVMNLSQAPTVYIDITTQSEWFIDPWDNMYWQTQIIGTHQLDNNSYNIIWNPAIINNTPAGATIENLKVQLIKTNEPWDPFGIKRGGFYALHPTSAIEITGFNPVIIGTYDQIEYIGKKEIVSGYPNSSTPIRILSYDETFGVDTGVRISFDVVPNSGATRSKLVKTFKAKEIKRYL